jgi:hypothetical protein
MASAGLASAVARHVHAIRRPRERSTKEALLLNRFPDVRAEVARVESRSTSRR